MKLLKFAASAVAITAFAGMATAAEQYIPVTAYWTGPYAPGGSGIAGGWVDYMKLVNKHGGVNGVKLVWEKCDSQYKPDLMIECYEKMKARAPLFHPFGTGLTYAIFERAWKDKIPVVTLGYGRTDASDGRVFPYLFPALTNYWSQNTAIIKFIGQQSGGMDKLKGMKIANVHHDSAYGKETIPILEAQAKKYGFEFKNFPVAHPGLDQKAIWLQIARQYKPDWVILRGWGVMNPTAIKEAARVGFPRNKMVGVWWSGAEEDVVPAGRAAKGYYAAGFHGSGTNYPVIQDILKEIYGAGEGELPKERVGSIYYNRGVVWGAFTVEAVRKAMERTNNQPVKGEDVQWALEHLEMTPKHIADLGMTGLMPPFKLSCSDHEGGGRAEFLQWDGNKWNVVSDWIDSDEALVRPLVEASAAKYAKEKGIKIRDCK